MYTGKRCIVRTTDLRLLVVLLRRAGTILLLDSQVRAVPVRPDCNRALCDLCKWVQSFSGMLITTEQPLSISGVVLCMLRYE